MFDPFQRLLNCFCRSAAVSRRTWVFLVVLWFVVPAAAHAQEEQPRVWKVSISGNDAFSDMVLREVVANRAVPFSRRMMVWKRHGEPFSDTELRRDVVRLERFYQRRGFPDVRVSYSYSSGRKDWRRNITFHITEGRPIRIVATELVYEGGADQEARLNAEKEFRKALNRHPLREGRRYESIRHTDAEGIFLRSLRNIGFAFAKAGVTAQVDTAAYEARVRIHLDPGPVTYIGQVRVEGHETVSERVVRNEAALRTGQRYDQRRVTRAQEEIFSHHLFRFVTISIPEQPRDSTVDLQIRVRENPLRSVQFRVGAGTEEYLRGGVTWQHRNPFGNAHGFSVSARASFMEQRVNLDYTIPYVLSTYTSYIFSPFAQRLDERSYLLYRMGAQNSLIYQFNRSLAGMLSYELTVNEETLKDTRAVIADSTQFYNQSVIRLSGFYDTAFIERGDGWALRPLLEVSGFLGTGTLKYERASVDVRRYLEFSRTLQMGLRAHGGILFAEDTSMLPANILYYLGGTNSVRGWSRWDLGPKRAAFHEDGRFAGYIPTGGRVSLSYNTEVRKFLRFIHPDFGLAMFFDGGQVWRTRGDVDIADLQFGIGGGLRYNSPIGPVRLDLGYKMNPTDEDLGRFNGVDYGGRFARWGVHFSIGQAF